MDRSKIEEILGRRSFQMTAADTFIENSWLSNEFDIFSELAIFGSDGSNYGLREKTISINAAYCFTRPELPFISKLIEDPLYLLKLLTIFLSTNKITPINSYNILTIMAKLINNNPTYINKIITQYFEKCDKLEIFKLLLDNIHNFGALEMMKIFLDHSDTLLKPYQSIIDLIIGNISNINSYEEANYYSHLMRSILTRGTWKCSAYQSPVYRFYCELFSESNFPKLMRILEGDRPNYSQLVVINILHKLFESQQRNGFNSGSETPTYFLVFIPQYEKAFFRVSIDLQNRISPIIAEVVNVFLFNLKGKLSEPDSSILIYLPYILKGIFLLLNELIQIIIDHPEFYKLFFSYLSFIPLLIMNDYPLLVGYCYKIFDLVLDNHRNSPKPILYDNPESSYQLLVRYFLPFEHKFYRQNIISRHYIILKYNFYFNVLEHMSLSFNDLITILRGEYKSNYKLYNSISSFIKTNNCNYTGFYRDFHEYYVDNNKFYKKEANLSPSSYF